MLFCSGDSLSSVNGELFMTWDTGGNIKFLNWPQMFRGASWYSSIAGSFARLNGVYIVGGDTTETYGIVWYYYNNTESNSYSLYKTQMKIAP